MKNNVFNKQFVEKIKVHQLYTHYPGHIKQNSALQCSKQNQKILLQQQQQKRNSAVIFPLHSLVFTQILPT